MDYFPSQVKTLSGLTDESFRHWRRVLPSIQGRKGKKANFSHGDVLALSIIKLIVMELGINVGKLTKISTEIFTICNDRSWLELNRGIFVIEPHLNKVEYIVESEFQSASDFFIQIRCQPIIAKLQTHIFTNTKENKQKELEFEPLLIKTSLSKQ